MRRFILASVLLLAGCATTPQQPQAGPPPSSLSTQRLRSLMGLTASDLVGYFGNPALQVREGNSLKLQFRSPSCVIDAYLYPPAGGSGTLRVTHSDARTPSGADTNQAGCIAALSRTG